MTCRLQNKTARAAEVNAVVGGPGDTGAANMPSFNCGGLFESPEAPGVGGEPSLRMPPRSRPERKTFYLHPNMRK